MLDELLPHMDDAVCTQASEPRSLTAAELAARAARGRRPPRPQRAGARRGGPARRPGAGPPAGQAAGSVLVAGSLYLLEDLRDVVAAQLGLYFLETRGGPHGAEDAEEGKSRDQVPGRVPHRRGHRARRLLRGLPHRHAPRHAAGAGYLLAAAGAVQPRPVAPDPPAGGDTSHNGSQSSAAAHTSRRDEHGITLITGATGYVGGRLVPRLLEQGHTRARARARPVAPRGPRLGAGGAGGARRPSERRRRGRGPGRRRCRLLPRAQHGRRPRLPRPRRRRRRRPSAAPPPPQACGASSTWAVSAIPPPTCPGTCARGTRRARPCARAACPSPSSAPPWWSAPAACRSR